MDRSRQGHALPLLDGLRGVAAVCVVLTHVGFQTGAAAGPGATGAVLARFDVGVALFFVLSGFLLTRPWAVAASSDLAPPARSRYLLRRAARILPAYWLVLGIVLVTTARGVGAATAWSNALLLQVYSGDLLPGFTQTWSLCTEVAFYLVLPLVAPLLARSWLVAPQRVIVGLSLACAGSLLWVALAAAEVLPRRAGQWLPGHLDWFVAGMALALLEVHRRNHPHGRVAGVADQLRRSPWGLLALCATLFWLATTPLAGPRALDPSTPSQAVLKEALYALVATGVVLAVALAPARSGALATVLGNPAAQFVGRTSYGVFLWHLLVMAGVYEVLDLQLFSGQFWMVLALTLTGTLAVAAVTWSVLESPVNARAHRRPLAPAGSASRRAPR